MSGNIITLKFGNPGSLNITSRTSETQKTVLSALDATIVSVGLFANIFTLAVVLRVRYRQTAFGVHLAWLSIADCGVLITHAIVSFAKHTDLSCRIVNFFNLLCMLLSSWGLVTVAGERVLAVYYPHRVRSWCTARKAMLFQTGLLLILAVICLGVPLTSRITQIGNTIKCLMETEYTSFIPSMIYKALLYSMIPFIFLLVLNSILVYGLRRSADFRHKSQVSKGQEMHVTRTSVMLIVNSMVFVITTLPVSVLATIFIAKCHVQLEQCEQFINSDYSVAAEYMFRLQDINHAVNFLVYFLSGSEFRAEALKVCKCWKEKAQANKGTIGSSGALVVGESSL